MNGDSDESILDASTFQDTCGESLESVLNLDTWEQDPNLADLCRRIEDEIEKAVQDEDELSREARRQVAAVLSDPTRPGAPPSAGLYRVSKEDLQRVWRQVLFNGAVEVCDGTCKPFETLPITITQIGVCLASYQGCVQSYAHRIYQRDLRIRSGDLMNDLMALLDRRKARSQDDAERAQGISVLARRGILAYAERAALAYKSDAPWRMGHGHPAPFELLTGSGSMELLRSSLSMLRDLIAGHKRFVFVPSEAADKRLLTLGYALRSGEYAIITTAQTQMTNIVEGGKYNPDDGKRALRFCEEIGPQIAIGAYRVSVSAPPYLFYSHVEHSHEAALIALADSLLLEYRGFPLLIDLADRLCRASFGNDIFEDAIQSAYARAGAPFRFLGERQTRD
ncbi:MAG TPA: hypothetical protein VFA07_08760 [Chthonomonadaceae bacterium]|nr:hypothetical protein [Chthonomonadaceae bacterium]